MGQLWRNVHEAQKRTNYEWMHMDTDEQTAIMIYPDATQELGDVLTYMNSYRDNVHTHCLVSPNNAAARNLIQPLGAIIIHYLEAPTSRYHHKLLDLFHFFHFGSMNEETHAAAHGSSGACGRMLPR